MKRIFNIFCLTVVLLLSAASCVHNGYSSASDFNLRDRTQAAEELIARVTGTHADSFIIRIREEQKEGRDWYSYYADNGKIILEGNNGVSIASALNDYLKSCCGWHYSWCGKNTELPDVLPLPEEPVTRTSPYIYRYCLNYCTFNYTMSWWNYDRWQREIDFMAMNGINMPLAVTGQNTVWQKVYNRLGITNEELHDFFSGPAYFNWFWMGNLDGWGGPLPQSFIDDHEALQKKILYSERSLGMTPVLPAFTGHVPPIFSEKFPDAQVRKTHWSNFDEVNILDPSEPIFDEIGKMFIEEQTRIYGTDHYYTADTFNENLPPCNDSLFLNDISAKVYNSMAAVDSEAVWVMQGWLFHHERDFWGEQQIKALLGAVPDDNMLILDLWSERFPVWQRTEAYYGKPWVWCMLHNFGQNITMSGNVTNVANGPAEALANPKAGRMSGIGLTMEGIEQTPIMYALMYENVWRDTPINVDEFLEKYIKNRYGHVEPNALKAWQLLFSDVFENEVNNGGQESIITGRPSFKKNPRRTTNTELHYDNAVLLEAWELMINLASEYSDRDGYRYDLVDLSRQALANYASDVQQEAAKAYQRGDIKAFKNASSRFLDLISDMDDLLKTREEFLLGRWLRDARALGHTEEEKNLYEFNARDLLTLWGHRDARLADYACRQWSGMMNGYYRHRWSLFFDTVLESMTQGKDFDQDAFNETCKDWEWAWVQGHETYSDKAEGDEIELCRYIFSKYFKLMN